jgi:hypothetical protein
MKNYISILIIILFFSCTAKKTVVQSRAEQKRNQQNAIISTMADQTREIVSIEGKLSDSVQTVTKTIKYDTSKPVSDITGKAPISEETTIMEVKIGNKTINKKTEVTNNVTSEVTDNSNIQTATKEESKAVEIPKPPAVKYYFYILIALIFLVAGFFVYRNIAKIKGFFVLDK